MTPVKRLDLWVSALVRCRVPLLWTHIGSGPEEEKIRNLCVSLPGHVQSRFLGRMRNKEVLCYYATNKVDLFANVSESEGLPVAIMEALSYGIPVGATLAGGTGELVSEDNGIVWPIDVSPEGIATDLEKYASLPTDVQERMRKAAVATWESKVSANKQYSQFAELLDDVLGPVG
jgi:glycosyltransferase involved in cell wall biosynthesis